ncbi:hypothetical protein DRO61_09795 [Candidatus Bathyarchaeota archaeon]|nr:MAG: hypothetical protein DRO61_09795 [Candidatus Bathyarchaeota archaeon]
MLLELQRTGEGRAVNVSGGGNITVANALADTQLNPNGKVDVINYEEHRTFPIITQFQILTSMFLQTIEWHRSVDDGHEAIKYHLLFRKWIPPTTFQVFNNHNTKDLEYGVKRFSMNTGKVGKVAHWLEFSVDALWKTQRYYGEVGGNIFLGLDGSSANEVHQEAVASVKRLLEGYIGGLYGII